VFNSETANLPTKGLRETATGSVSAVRQPGKLPSYHMPDDALEMGASLGNKHCWVNTRGNGSIQSIFSTDIGMAIANSVSLRYSGPGHRLLPGLGQSSAGPDADVQLSALPGGQFEIHPAYQKHTFTLPGLLTIEETVFLPLTGDDDPAAAYLLVRVTNDAPAEAIGGAEGHASGVAATGPRRLRLHAFARLRGTLPADVQATYDPRLGAFIARNASQPNAVRLFGVTAPVSHYETSHDFGRVYDLQHAANLRDDVTASGDILAALQVDLALAPGQSIELAFLVAFSAQGEQAARAVYSAALDAPAALRATVDYLTRVVAVGEVLTPDPAINDGALWSKVNMLRVMATYPQGPAFTNEPGVSSNVVGRDVAWFVYGNDHFLPDFSRALLDTFARLQYPSGKLPEYYSALDGRVEDYKLNINDDTPLFILAVNHHWRSTGNRAWLEGIYPAVAKAALYILDQRDERGLVVCTTRGEEVWGICSWRNVIPQYTINGAVTEINAECAAALRATAHLAQNLGRPADEAKAFFDAAEALRVAMDAHLLNPANGLYYLNIDLDGNPHTDVTGDEVFPVIFRVCSDDVAFRIISRLNSPDFWTAAGLRTASVDDPLYDPFRFVGLIGGVWPGLTWWYAFAAARYHPEFMVAALRASFQHYAANPRKNNTVPGQFSEWFDGESLVNRGMRLSPWEPPRFLWAAVEGVCGVMLTTGNLSVRPLVPRTWDWVALRGLPYHGGSVTYFAARERHGFDTGSSEFHLYATAPVDTEHALEIYTDDVTDQVGVLNPAVRHIALRRPGEVLVCLGNASGETAITPLDLSAVLDAQATYMARVYNSERDDWSDGAPTPGHLLASLATTLESGGCRVARLIVQP